MKKFIRTILMAVILVFISHKSLFSLTLPNFNNNPKNYNVKLKIIDKAQIVANFEVAIAKDEAHRAYGLMNLEHLPLHHGMLFIFANDQIVNMWMKDTLIALDMIFIDRNNNIVKINSQATPRSLAAISSQEKVDKVLEINGGLCNKFGIKIGQKIIYENF